MTLYLPSGRSLRTRTTKRYVLVVDDVRTGGPPFAVYYSDVLDHCHQLTGWDFIVDTTTGRTFR